MRIGNKLFAGRSSIVNNGHYKTIGPRIYDRHIGNLSGLPFDKNVKDGLGNIIGKLEGPFSGIYNLRKR